MLARALSTPQQGETMDERNNGFFSIENNAHITDGSCCVVEQFKSREVEVNQQWFRSREPISDCHPAVAELGEFVEMRFRDFIEQLSVIIFNLQISCFDGTFWCWKTGNRIRNFIRLDKISWDDFDFLSLKSKIFFKVKHWRYSIYFRIILVGRKIWCKKWDPTTDEI